MADRNNNNPAIEDIDNDEEYYDLMTPVDLEEAEEKEKEANAIAKREKLEQSLSQQNNLWGYSSLGIEARKAAMTMLSTKTGLYSRIPLICKGAKCPYKETCGLTKYDLTPIGEYCPLETAQIEMSVSKYVKEFQISDDDFTDQNILREIVNLEIMMERCKSLMSSEQNPIIDVITNITQEGESYTHPEVSKAFEMYERCQKQHSSLLNLMNATRKDKVNAGIGESGNLISDILDKISSIEADGGFVDPQRNTSDTTYVYYGYNNNEDNNKKGT